MQRIFLHTERRRALSWGLIGAGLLLLALAPAGRERLWVPFVLAGVAVEFIGIALRHHHARDGGGPAKPERPEGP